MRPEAQEGLKGELSKEGAQKEPLECSFKGWSKIYTRNGKENMNK